MSVPFRSFVAILMASLIACAWLAPLDLPATQHVDDGLKRALVSFATARALNAAISVAQGTEISVQPVGVGATFAPGQLLDPVNDLVERFSDLMLGASVLFGTQKVLIGIGGYWPVSLALTLVILAWAWQWLRRQPVAPWLSRLLVLLLMLRFAVPVVAIGSDWVWQKFLAEDYRVSQQAIDTAQVDAARQDPALPSEPSSQGLIDKLRGWLSHNTDLKARFDELKQAVENATEHLIRLMVVFVLQTLVIPALMIWAMWTWTRSLFDSPRR